MKEKTMSTIEVLLQKMADPDLEENVFNDLLSRVRLLKELMS